MLPGRVLIERRLSVGEDDEHLRRHRNGGAAPAEFVDHHVARDHQQVRTELADAVVGLAGTGRESLREHLLDHVESVFRSQPESAARPAPRGLDVTPLPDEAANPLRVRVVDLAEDRPLAGTKPPEQLGLSEKDWHGEATRLYSGRAEGPASI